MSAKTERELDRRRRLRAEKQHEHGQADDQAHADLAEDLIEVAAAHDHQLPERKAA
jgi:hypothetical protein